MDAHSLHARDEGLPEPEPAAAVSVQPVGSPTRRVGDKVAEPYQARVMLAVRAAIAAGRSGAVLAPTGSGKSLLVAAAIEDALDLGRPILVLHPDVSLLRQNFAQAASIPALARARVSSFIAATDHLGDGGHLRNTMEADVVFATNPSLTNKIGDEDFLQGVRAFGRAGGVVVIDEGHKAAAEQLGRILAAIAEAGGSGLILTATPFRTDGADPLEPFGASVEHDLVGVASFKEVLATGRTVRTRFEIASGEFEAHLGKDAVNLIESAFLALLAERKSIDQASQAAFAKFFKPGAGKADQAIAELIVGAVGRIWLDRCAAARLAMIHCDSVDFARELSAHLGALRLPEGHPRAGEHPNVAYVVAADIRVYEGGAEKDIVPDRERGVRKMKRDDILHAARAGGFDVLVNVNALGVGTDVPQNDLNILACQERSIGPTKQISGRGERAHAPTGKTHQCFVDIGNSVLRIFNDIDAMRRGDPERSRRQVRGLAPEIRAQFEDWFDTDPGLPDQIARRLREIRKRGADGETATFHDALDPTMPWDEDAVLPIPRPFANGLLAASSRRYDSESKTYFSRIALFCDLRGFGLYQPGCSEDLPNWLVVTYDQKIRAKQSFLCSDLDTARRYAAFIGVKADPKFEDAPASDRQAGYARALVRNGGPFEKWLLPFAQIEGQAHVGAVIDLMKERLFARLLAHGSSRIVERATGAQGLVHPIRSIVLERPNQITPQRRELLAAYAGLRQRLRTLLPTNPSVQVPFTVVTYDPSVMPEVRREIEAVGGRFQVIDEPERVESLRTRLAEGLAAGRVTAIGPEGPADAWIRGKAGIGRHDPATRAREGEFRTLFEALCPFEPGTGTRMLLLQRKEAIEVAQAPPGTVPSRPMAGAAMVLIAVLRTEAQSTGDVAATQVIVAGIAAGDAEFGVPVDPTSLFARYAMCKAELQKKAIKGLQRAIEFQERKLAWNARVAQAPSEIGRRSAA